MNYNLNELTTLMPLEVARNCSYLINVASQMAKDWHNQPQKDKCNDFVWTPTDSCPYIQESISKFDFHCVELLWSTFDTLSTLKRANEPFGFIVKLKNSNTAYLVFRGSQTDLDFIADIQFFQTEYPNGGKVSEGFYNVFQGLTTLESALQKTSADNLVICGHSLGSTLATLSVPVAIDSGFSPNSITVFPQASPKIGNQDFANYFNGLGVKLIRLVNTVDCVPKLPPALGDPPKYVHVGDEVDFTADYQKEALNHNPCCSYAYALVHPENPVNPDNNGNNCVFPSNEEPEIHGPA